MKVLSQILTGTALIAMTLAFSPAAKADGHAQPFSSEAFMQAQSMGKTIVVDVYKQGCPTCKAQQPALAKAAEMYPEAVFFKVDFMKDKATVEKLGATMQSTLVVYKGDKETGRLTGETNESKILDLVKSGM